VLLISPLKQQDFVGPDGYVAKMYGKGEKLVLLFFKKKMCFFFSSVFQKMSKFCASRSVKREVWKLFCVLMVLCFRAPSKAAEGDIITIIDDIFQHFNSGCSSDGSDDHSHARGPQHDTHRLSCGWCSNCELFVFFYFIFYRTKDGDQKVL
jgi:hypothetical protein